nr:MAG TPA: minor tail protein [Caudoviricetes sp.]
MDKTVKFKIELETNGQKVLHDVTVSTGELRDALVEVGKEAKLSAEKMTSLASTSMMVDALTNVVDRLCSSVNDLADDWNSFDKGMRAVNTMAGKNAEDLGKLKDQVAALGNEIPKTKEELSAGLYQVISNGVPENNWIAFLEQSAKASVGGIADLGQTVTVTSTIIKNYGLEWDKAGEIQDKIQMTAKNGVTSFEQLAAALPRVSGNAATLGVSIDELMATFATLTGVSGNTAEVSTQLAAVFTALVKPSIEATKMAQDMGIQFDAAAIRAQGGMRNFLTQLDADITKYASAHNMLKEEIYGKLFGSAESLRALTPLTGELASKFRENVDAMAGSEGTIEQAFENMAGSGESVTQMLRNQLSTMFDWAGSIASTIQPYLTFIAIGGQAIIGIMLLGKAIGTATAAISAFAVAQRSGAAATALATLHERISTIARNMLTAATGSATVSTAALTVATIALYAALTMGLSAVITGLVALFSSLSDETGELDDKTRSLIDAEERAKRENEAVEQMRQQEQKTLENVRAELELNIAKTKDFKGSKADEKKIVDELNNTYGATMGYFSSVADWYKALVANSEAYCQQMIIEARTRMLANQIAQKEQENYDITHNADGSTRRYSTRKRSHTETDWDRTYQGADGMTYYGTKVVYDDSDLDKAQKAYDANNAFIQSRKKQMQDLARQRTKMPVTGSPHRPAAPTGGGAGSGGSSNSDKNKNNTNTNKEKTRQQELNKLISDAQNEYVDASETERAEIAKKIVAYRAELDLIETLQKKAMVPEELKTIQDIDDALAYQQALRKHANKENIAGIDAEIDKLEQQRAEMQRPAQLKSLEDIDAEITYQQSLRKRATAETIGGIDAEIERLEGLRKTLERSGHKELAIKEIATYEQLDKELAYYTDLLNTSSEKDRASIQQRINALNELRQTWDEALAELKKPGEIATLDTMEKLDEAITYYQTKQKKATDEEFDNIGKTIAALERKRAAILRGTDLQEQLRDANATNALSGREYRVKVSGMGFDALTEKIRDLQMMLSDTENPVTGAQRKDIEELIKIYEKWRKESVKSMDTVKKGWSSLKGVGDSVEGITDALKGNGDAWQKVTAVIDGVLQLYDSFSGIIEIIQMLTKVTTSHAVAKDVEAASETTEAGTNAAAGAEAIALSGAQTAAAGIEAGAWSAVAAAKTFAAHAYIPFAGTPIAAGFVATQQGIIAAAGLPKFADGGLAYGPTLGLFGEYAGASNNPEVVAPLSKLKGMLADVGGLGGGRVVFKIEGRTLVGILKKETTHQARTK